MPLSGHQVDSFIGVSAGTKWDLVDGSLRWISSGGAGEVWGVGGVNKIYRREGVTKDNPTGTSWSLVEGNLTQVDVFGGTVWGVNSLQEVWNARESGTWNNIPDPPLHTILEMCI